MEEQVDRVAELSWNLIEELSQTTDEEVRRNKIASHIDIVASSNFNPVPDFKSGAKLSVSLLIQPICQPYTQLHTIVYLGGHAFQGNHLPNITFQLPIIPTQELPNIFFFK
jgi:hypothetical protein